MIKIDATREIKEKKLIRPETIYPVVGKQPKPFILTSEPTDQLKTPATGYWRYNSGRIKAERKEETAKSLLSFEE